MTVFTKTLHREETCGPFGGLAASQVVADSVERLYNLLIYIYFSYLYNYLIMIFTLCVLASLCLFCYSCLSQISFYCDNMFLFVCNCELLDATIFLVINKVSVCLSVCLTLDKLWLVGTPHALEDAVVEGLGQLCGHGRVEVWLVALQDTLQCELAHTQHLKVPVHDALAPRPAALVLEQPQVQDLAHSEE